MSKAALQFLGYLTLGDHQAFQAYAHQLGLPAGRVALMLIRREMVAHRLSSLETQAGPGRTRAKVPGRFGDLREKAEFERHARSCGVSPAAAATLLFRAELTERWLARSLGGLNLSPPSNHHNLVEASDGF